MRPQERGFLLLASTLGDPECHPLTLAQFRTLASRMAAMERPAFDREMNGDDLLALGYGKAMAQRILDLLSRDKLLDHYLAAGRRNGCVPVTRISEGYPLLLRKRLGLDSPACLWAKGDLSVLDTPGIALVGSRDLSAENRKFAETVGIQAAKQGFVLISGNARGADRTAQDAALASGGSVISVVADALMDHSPKDRILYLSEDSFDLPFSAQRAISRNRIIHAMGWRTLVAQVSAGSGGTWDGSVKNLRHNWSPLFCFEDGSEGARALVDLGAQEVTLEMLSDFSSIRENITSFFDQ